MELVTEIKKLTDKEREGEGETEKEWEGIKERWRENERMRIDRYRDNAFLINKLILCLVSYNHSKRAVNKKKKYRHPPPPPQEIEPSHNFRVS